MLSFKEAKFKLCFGTRFLQDILFSIPLIFFPSTVLYVGAFYFAKLVGLQTLQDHAQKIEVGPFDIVGFLLLAPLAETILLALLLNVLYKYQFSTTTASFIAGSIFAFAHALLSPLRFFGTIWSFFVFSKLYYAWCNKNKKKGAYAAFFPHVGINLVSVLILSSA